MEIKLLADEPAAVTTVARWYFDEWACHVPGATLDKVAAKLALANGRDTAPLIVLAKVEQTIVGAAELKIREMTIYPEYEHWLGGVYVARHQRGRGIATSLASEILGRARDAGIQTLYLQTRDMSGGLYSALGFRPVEEVNYNGDNILVMVAEMNTL